MEYNFQKKVLCNTYSPALHTYYLPHVSVGSTLSWTVFATRRSPHALRRTSASGSYPVTLLPSVVLSLDTPWCHCQTPVRNMSSIYTLGGQKSRPSRHVTRVEIRTDRGRQEQIGEDLARANVRLILQGPM